MKLSQINLLWHSHILLYIVLRLLSSIINLKTDFFPLWTSPNYITVLFICYFIIFALLCYLDGKTVLFVGNQTGIATLHDTYPQMIQWRIICYFYVPRPRDGKRRERGKKKNGYKKTEDIKEQRIKREKAGKQQGTTV